MSKSRSATKNESTLTAVSRMTKKTVVLSAERRKERKSWAAKIQQRTWQEELLSC